MQWRPLQLLRQAVSQDYTCCSATLHRRLELCLNWFACSAANGPIPYRYRFVEALDTVDWRQHDIIAPIKNQHVRGLIRAAIEPSFTAWPAGNVLDDGLAASTPGSSTLL